jgi:hypothetical protein
MLGLCMYRANGRYQCNIAEYGQASRPMQSERCDSPTFIYAQHVVERVMNICPRMSSSRSIRTTTWVDLSKVVLRGPDVHRPSPVPAHWVWTTPNETSALLHVEILLSKREPDMCEIPDPLWALRAGVHSTSGKAPGCHARHACRLKTRSTTCNVPCR